MKLQARVVLKNTTRREKTRHAMHLRKKKVLSDWGNKGLRNVGSRWRWWNTLTTPVKEKASSAKKIKTLKKKSTRCSYITTLVAMRRNLKGSGKKRRLGKICVKHVHSKIDTRSHVPIQRRPELDQNILEMEPPPPGPARVKWARETAALKGRLCMRKHAEKKSK
ncbi:hypothetical protein E2C01_061500 [Portunus trituberculatus]|uniref:Uncharacterized protein n=1 Tax=Portunus trituberculatus TaxID=210409 RepID=A0A5B7HBF7_PORTR|nr:hypothetical protein [Portunus trituberculatus]